MTITGWMVYACAIGLLVAPAAWSLERGLSRVGLPTRWIWLGGLVLSLSLPLAGGLRGTEPPLQVVVELEEQIQTGEQPTSRGRPETAGAVGWGAIGDVLDQWMGGFDRALAAAARALPGGAGVSRWVAATWATASVLMGLFVATSLTRLAGRVRRLPVRSLSGREVRVSPDFGPATIGLWRSDIVVPRWTLDSLRPPELEMVLQHEEEHQTARDPLVLAAGLLAVIACPWNPFMWWQLRRLGDAVEIDCDRRVLRRGASARQYGELLLRVGCAGIGRPLAAPSLAASHPPLERRLTAMRKRTHVETAIPALLGTVLVSVALVATACGTEAPLQSEAQQSVVSEDPEQVLELWVREDGDGPVER